MTSSYPAKFWVLARAASPAAAAARRWRGVWRGRRRSCGAISTDEEMKGKTRDFVGGDCGTVHSFFHLLGLRRWRLRHSSGEIARARGVAVVRPPTYASRVDDRCPPAPGVGLVSTLTDPFYLTCRLVVVYGLLRVAICLVLQVSEWDRMPSSSSNTYAPYLFQSVCGFFWK